ncbi:MAG: hypothetical protein ABJF01_08260 [bacterium]
MEPTASDNAVAPLVELHIAPDGFRAAVDVIVDGDFFADRLGRGPADCGARTTGVSAEATTA